MTLPNDKQDLVRITSQRDPIGRMIRKAPENSPLCAAPEALGKKRPAYAATRPTTTPQSTAEPTPDTANAPPVLVPNSGPLTSALDPAAEELHPPTAENSAPDDSDRDPPLWVQQASLSELLLWRLGLPIDRERMEREYAESQADFDLKPPITTRKVADTIARLSMRLMRGEVDATSAKTSLYALQTLLTALRLQIVEEKKPKNTRTRARKPARRKKQNAKR